MKTCVNCQAEKPNGEFCKNTNNKDGLHSYCKECSRLKTKAWQEANRDKYNAYQRERRVREKNNDPSAYQEKLRIQEKRIKEYRRTPKGRAGVMWNALCQRSNSVYVGVENKLTRKLFVEWAVEEIKRFQKQHPGETPSLDRIDAEGHYEIGNIRIISLGRNVIRSKMLMKKIGLESNSHKDDVFEKLSMAVFGVCANTESSVEEFAEYLLKVANDKYLWDGEVI